MNEAAILIIVVVLCIVGLFVFIGLSTLFVTIPVFGTLGGVAWLFNRQLKQAREMRSAAQSWPSIQGVIIKSRVIVSGGDYTSVSPSIHYNYQVDGQDYTASQVLAGDVYAERYSSSQSYDLVDQYPVGSEVDVYYNPEDPSIAALER